MTINPLLTRKTSIHQKPLKSFIWSGIWTDVSIIERREESNTSISEVILTYLKYFIKYMNKIYEKGNFQKFKNDIFIKYMN